VSPVPRPGFDRRLLAPGPSQRVVLVHRLLAAAIAFRLLERPWWRSAHRPAELFDPVWVIGWLPGQPPLALLVALQALGVAAGIAAAARLAPRLTFPIAWACLVFVAAVWGSSGKVMHNEVLLVTAAVPLLVADLPRRHEAPTVSTRWGWPPRAAAVALGAVYLATGVQKLRHSGLRWVFSDNMAWVVRQGTSPFGRDLNLWLGRHEVVLAAVAGGALAFELGAPLLLWFRRTRLLVPVISLTMHGSIWLLLGLNYSPWVLTAAAVSIPLALHWSPPVDGRPGARHLDLPWRLAPADDEPVAADASPDLDVSAAGDVPPPATSRQATAPPVT